MPRALPRGTRHPRGVADLGVWVTIALLLAITALALGQWVTGAFTPAADRKVTPATVAPAVEYQP